MSPAEVLLFELVSADPLPSSEFLGGSDGGIEDGTLSDVVGRDPVGEIVTVLVSTVLSGTWTEVDGGGFGVVLTGVLLSVVEMTTTWAGIRIVVVTGVRGFEYVSGLGIEVIEG